MEEKLEFISEQIINIFLSEGVQDSKHAVESIKIAFNEGDVFMLPTDAEIINIFNNWSKTVGLSEVQKMTDDMFNSYNDAIEDVLELMNRLKSTNKESLIKKIEKLKK